MPNRIEGAAAGGIGHVTGARSLTGSLDFEAMGAGATAFMNKAEAQNKAAIDGDGIGLRYGEQSAYGKMNQAQRYSYVKSVVRAKNPSKINDTAYLSGLISRMRSTSCIGYTMEVLAAGYAAAGQSERWSEIQRIVRAAGVIGTVLMPELQKDGWQGVYWNADTRTYRGPRSSAGDAGRMKDHNYFVSKFVDRASGEFKQGASYYGTTPSLGLLNFFAAPAGSDPRPDPSQLAHLRAVPFWVGVAASGYHTFPGTGLKVRDSHVARNPEDRTNFENRPFEDLDYAWDTANRRRKTTPEGRPVYSEEQSGVMLVPPGTWSN